MKSASIEIRVQADEKAAFKQAAEIAGIRCLRG